MSNKEQRIALVTGASRGIGAAIADALKAAGFIVVGTATTAPGAEKIEERLAPHGGGLVLDVASTDSISAALAELKERFGAPLVLVNNAGITQDNIIMRMKEDEWDKVINTNLSALYRVIKPCLRDMTRARWGRIINISSVVGSMGNAGQANYAAAKAGVDGLTRALARELGSRSITVNSVAPGFIQTDMTDNLPEAQKEALLAQIPLGRLGQAEEVASAVAWLASEGAAYVTGTVLHINGGMFTG